MLFSSLTEVQSWLYLAHISQFSKAGAYQSFDIAGFPVFLIRGKDSKIRAVRLLHLMTVQTRLTFTTSFIMFADTVRILSPGKRPVIPRFSVAVIMAGAMILRDDW